MRALTHVDTATTLTPCRPPLKWAGGKRWQIPYLSPHWSRHRHRRLVEPFCGGLAVTLGLRPSQALLNDVNLHLVNFYRWLKRGLTVSIRMENDEALYYEHRLRFNELVASGQHGSQEAASLFYFLNRTGYNGLCRFNQQGAFNVPFGRYATIAYRRDFQSYRQVLGAWRFTAQSFAALTIDRGDFVYADPPYDVDFTQYAKGGFAWEEQMEAAEWLARHRGPVVLSNQATERIVRLYQRLGFTLEFLPAPRMINCTGDRTPAREVLALRNL